MISTSLLLVMRSESVRGCAVTGLMRRKILKFSSKEGAWGLLVGVVGSLGSCFLSGSHLGLLIQIIVHR